MKVGTRSLLFGGHQFLIHPLMVALAWRCIYGRFPRDLQTWAAFFLHDIGYVGLPNMDGDEGKEHPARGAHLMGGLFGVPWFWFTAGHSRYYAALIDGDVSPLMRADKYATVITPLPLYCLLITLSGEWREYLDYHAEATGRDAYPRTWRGVMRYARDLRSDWRRFGPQGCVGRGAGDERADS